MKLSLSVLSTINSAISARKHNYQRLQPGAVRFCGSSDWSVLSHGFVVSLIFTSDSYLENGGFQLRYRFVRKSNCPYGYLSCRNNCGCFPPEWKCDGSKDCADGSDEMFNSSIQHCNRPAIAPDETRIVGGKETIPNSWPWMVSLRLFGGHFCGGSILNANWIVTAAHCVENYMSPSNWRVDAGRHCRDCTPSTLQSRKVTQVVKYPSYDSSRTNQDLAMMRVDQPFQFNSQVSPVYLPSSPVSNTASCFATGWGNTQGTGDSTRLQQVMVPIVPNSICGDSSHYGGAITSYMLCAGYEQGGKDACQGDSGGPLVCSYAVGVWHLHGITSWGEGCIKAQRPGVYTRVQMYTSWIHQTGSG